MLLPPIQQAVNKYCIPRLAAYTEIVVSSFSNNAELIGAAALVVENFDMQKMRPVTQKPKKEVITTV
jgi:hypothetical protein